MIFRRAVCIASSVTALAIVLSISAVPHDPKDWPVPEAAKKMRNPMPRTEAALRAAKDIFNDRCVNCHGDAGKGDGPDAMMYTPKPADLTDAHMMGMMSDGEIFYKISEGRNAMLAFKKLLSEEQRWQLVHFVRTLAPKMHHAPKPSAKQAKPATKKAPDNRN